MSVAVNEAGHQCVLRIVSGDCGAVFFCRLIAGQNFEYLIVVNGDAMLFKITVFVINRDNPAGMQQSVNVFHVATIPVAQDECNFCDHC